MVAREQRDLRRRNVLRRWPRFHWDPFGRPRIEVWTPVQISHGLWMTSWIAAMFLEMHGQGFVAETARITPAVFSTPAGQGAWMLAAAAGALLADRLFESSTPLGARPAGWRRALRLLILTIPVIGLLLRLAWYRLAPHVRCLRGLPADHPSLDPGMDRTSSAPGSLVRLDLRLGSIWQHGWAFFFGVLVFQILPWLAAVDALGQAARSGGRAAASVQILCGILHILSFGAFLIALREQRREAPLKAGETVAAGAGLLGSLPPFPWSLAAMFAILPVIERMRPFVHGATVVAALYKRHLGGHALKSVTPAVSLERVQGSAARGRRRFSTLKLLLLALEVTALAWLLAPRAGIALLSADVRRWLVVLSTGVALPGLLAWLFLVVHRSIAGHSGSAVSSAAPDLTFLVLVPPVLMQALVTGSLAGSEDRSTLGVYLDILFLQGLVLALLLGALPAVELFAGKAPGPWDLSNPALGLILSVLLSGAGALLVDPAAGPRLLATGRDLCPFVFFASPLAGLVLGRPLLRPFRWRDLWNRQLPGLVRRNLLFIAAPAILPFGGLAVPWWNRTRYQLERAWGCDLMRVRGGSE